MKRDEFDQIVKNRITHIKRESWYTTHMFSSSLAVSLPRFSINLFNLTVINKVMLVLNCV